MKVVRCDTRSNFNVFCPTLVYEDNKGMTRNARSGCLHTCERPTDITMAEILGTNSAPKEKGMESTNGAVVNSAAVTRYPKRGVSSTQMKMGEIALIVHGSISNNTHIGEPLMRTSDGWVLLTQPSLTWGQGGNFDVDILTTGDTITLRVSGSAFSEDDTLILNLLRTGRKIEAIKKRREITGDGLKESKDYVDEFERKAVAAGALVPKTPRW